MNRQIAARLIFASVLVAALAVIPAYAQGVPPSPPHAFFGAVTVNGQPAPVGAVIKATGNGVLSDPDDPESGNPIVVTVAGRYGGPTAAELKLGAWGNIAEGTPLEFFVDDVKAQCAYVNPDNGAPSQWQDSYPFASGVVTNLNLRVVGATPTFTPTSTVAPTATSRPRLTEDSVVPTATRRIPQAAASPSATPSTSTSTAPPSPGSAVSPAATAAAARNVVVATPTTPAAPGSVAAATPSATPALQPTPTPSATATAVTPTVRPTDTLTPALLVRLPRATSNPILEPGTALPTAQAPAPSTSSSGGAASGRTLVLGGGLAALAIAIAAGVLIGVRGRPR